MTTTVAEAHQQIAVRYPRSASLRDGHRISLRLMAPGDEDLILNFARSLPSDDLLFLRRDITQPSSVDRWMQEVVEQRTFTVLGFDGDELLGEGDLNYSSADWTRHLGEIRLLALAQRARPRAGTCAGRRDLRDSRSCSSCNS